MNKYVDPSWGEGAFPIRLHPHFSLVPFSALSQSAKDLCRAGGEESLPESLLIPKFNHASSVVSLRGAHRIALEQLQKGCTWSEALSALSLSDVERLFASGVLSAKFDGQFVSGPVVPLFVKSAASGLPPQTLKTDLLSTRCLSHAARLPVNDGLELSRRMYHFNQHGVYACNRVQEIVEASNRLVATSYMEEFKEISPASISISWRHFGRSALHPLPALDQPKAHKLYISPCVDSLVDCLERLIHILPRTSAFAWKMGAGIFGLTRPDKICVYFRSQLEADHAAGILLPLLDGVGAQGVPFTKRYDDYGLISGGIDPPDITLGTLTEGGTSWREWICRKLSAGILLARRDSNYPLDPVQSALWGMYYMGVDAETWAVTDLRFWRN